MSGFLTTHSDIFNQMQAVFDTISSDFAKSNKDLCDRAYENLMQSRILTNCASLYAMQLRCEVASSNYLAFQAHYGHPPAGSGVISHDPGLYKILREIVSGELHRSIELVHFYENQETLGPLRDQVLERHEAYSFRAHERLEMFNRSFNFHVRLMGDIAFGNQVAADAVSNAMRIGDNPTSGYREFLIRLYKDPVFAKTIFSRPHGNVTIPYDAHKPKYSATDAIHDLSDVALGLEIPLAVRDAQIHFNDVFMRGSEKDVLLDARYVRVSPFSTLLQVLSHMSSSFQSQQAWRSESVFKDMSAVYSDYISSSIRAEYTTQGLFENFKIHTDALNNLPITPDQALSFFNEKKLAGVEMLQSMSPKAFAQTLRALSKIPFAALSVGALAIYDYAQVRARDARDQAIENNRYKKMQRSKGRSR